MNNPTPTLLDRHGNAAHVHVHHVGQIGGRPALLVDGELCVVVWAEGEDA